MLVWHNPLLNLRFRRVKRRAHSRRLIDGKIKSPAGNLSVDETANVGIDQGGREILARSHFNKTIPQRRNPAMDELTEHLMNVADDGFWGEIQSEARREAECEPVLVSFLHASVLRHRKLEDALGVILANKLQTPELPAILLRDLINEVLTEHVLIRALIRADLLAARSETPRHMATRDHFCITRVFTLSKRTVSRTGCGSRGGRPWPRTSRIASRRHLGSTSIPRLGSARES